MEKTRYIMILFDRETNGQITAAFRDLNYIDQAKEGLVRQMKIWQEQKGQRKIIEAKDVDIEKVISEMKWEQ